MIFARSYFCPWLAVRDLVKSALSECRERVLVDSKGQHYEIYGTESVPYSMGLLSSIIKTSFRGSIPPRDEPMRRREISWKQT